MRFPNIIISTCLILFYCCILNAANDSIIDKLPDGSVFKGVKINNIDSVYHGTLQSIDFTRVEGFFCNDEDNGLNPLFIRFTNAAQDTTFINIFYKNKIRCYHRKFYRNDDFLLVDTMHGLVNSHSKRMKLFSQEEQTWKIFISSDDYQRGREYTPKHDTLKDISSSSSEIENSFMWILHYILMIVFSLAVIFYPFIDNDKYPIRSKIILIICLAIIVFSFVFVDTWTQKQLTFVFFSLIVVGIISMYFSKYGKLSHAIIHILLCAIALTGWSYYLFYNLDDKAVLSDGKEIPIKWRSGTDYNKRRLIKKIFHDMVPVNVKDHGKQYTVYVNKYEFSETEFAVLNDEMYEWFFALFNTHDEPLDDFSYRESRFVLSMIQKLCNVRFDFLSYPEWQSAALGKHHSINEEGIEMLDVDEGPTNELGLVNINGNAAEYTSNYYSTLRLSISADTLYNTYDDVIICGSAYDNIEPIDSSIVNKNLREGAVGFRLIYRPDNIGARRYSILGYLRSDLSVSLPKIIALYSINGKKISSFDSYEAFEEYLIENRHLSSTIEYYDNSKTRLVTTTMPPGFGYYDFIPFFTFVGMDNEIK